MSNYNIPGKIDLTPRRHHGYAVLLFIMGTLFPPLAVAARFGIGKDFWLNLLLTICGYIPGHGHNFYIQNIRNNKNHARTPKWAQKWGLVDISEIKRKERRSQWAHRYNDRLPRSTLEGQPYEEGQEPGRSSTDLSLSSGRGANGVANGRAKGNGELWSPSDEHYYGERNSNDDSRSSGRWHYPANFDDAELTAIPKQRRKKDKRDRWARTQEAYASAAGDDKHSNKKRKSSKKKKKSRSGVGDTSSLPDSMASRDSTTEFPEDPEGGLYGNSSRVPEGEDNGGVKGKKQTTDQELFNHEF